MKNTAWSKSPPRLGQPVLDAIVRPNVVVREFTVLKRNGDAIRRKRRPEIIDTIHLSFDV